MSTTCGRTDEHSAHPHFYGWPRQQTVCSGKTLPPTAVELLAQRFVDEVRRDVLKELFAYVQGQYDATNPSTSWSAGYMAALDDLRGEINRLRRGDRGGR
jgi:hypothetical protein